MIRWSAATVSVVVALLLVTLSGQQPRLPDADAAYVAGEVLVQFDPAAAASQRIAALASRGATRIRGFRTVDVDHVLLPPGLTVEGAVAWLQSVPGVVSAQPNYYRRPVQSAAPPDDPFWLDGSLWGLAKIQADSAWAGFTTGDSGVVVADIDTGVHYAHPDLAANMWRNPGEIPGNGLDDDGNGYVDDVYGIDTVNHDSNPTDDHGHGTHTAGTIAGAGNNGIGVTGINWNAKVLACKFINAAGYGTDAGAIECFNYIVALKNRGVNIRVSSNSWGSARGSLPPSAAVQAAIDGAGAAGIINIFAAGNDGTNNDTTPFDPASYESPSVVAVASSGRTDRRSFFSNYGAASVDLAAPGEDILSTYVGTEYEYASGTSMAAPHVAGVAALVAGMNPSLSVADIKAILIDSVDRQPRWNGVVASGGRLNAYRAAAAVGTVTPNEPPAVSITSPADGAIFALPATITIDASAADADGTVQQVAFYANGMALGADASAPYGVTWNNAPSGQYLLTAVATDNRGATSASAAVQVTVPSNLPPGVSIGSPAEGAAFVSPATIAVDAVAADSDGSIQHVAFYANGIAIGVDASSPYAASWDAPAGTYTLTAIATDNLGATTTSSPVHVTVSPLAGRTNVALASAGAVAIGSSTYSPKYPAAGATNGDRKGLNWGNGGGWNDGTSYASPDWLQVDFRGAKLIEEIDVFSMQDNYASPVEPTPAMTFTSWGLRAFEVQYWDGAAWIAIPGAAVSANTLVWRQFVFVPVTTTKIRVYVTGALNGYSRIMEVEAWGVPAAGNSPPAVSITSPASGAAFVAPAAIAVAADAVDSDGAIQQVDFYANGVWIGADTSSPYALTWSNVEAGSHAITAVATDDLGAAETSAPSAVTVSANVAPAVAITSPADGASFVAPANIAVVAAASDADGSIASVGFYVNGVLAATDASPPYSFAWDGVMAGSHTLTAVATDNAGVSTTSAAVHVAVTPNPARINHALAANGGVAAASSTYGVKYPASSVTNGDRRGLNWGNGGGWNDGTAYASPDWIEVAFGGSRTIDEVNVFSMQDNYSSPAEPTRAMTFTSWGLRAFEVQYWNGAGWVSIPGASVTNNNLVWRQFLFSPVTTTRIRVYITAALNGYSRVMEVEAWGSQ